MPGSTRGNALQIPASNRRGCVIHHAAGTDARRCTTCDFRYDGVSVSEADGETIDAFRTYYDTSAFLSGTKR